MLTIRCSASMVALSLLALAADGAAGQRGDLAGPGARAADDQVGPHGGALAGAYVFYFGAGDAAALQQQAHQAAAQAEQPFVATRRAARLFGDFRYQTRKSWSRQRRVVGQAEHLEKGPNPRFVVTSLGAESWPAQRL